MIAAVDGALHRLVREAVRDDGVAVTLEAPTREWAARRSGPAVDLYLYDVREAVERRQSGYDALTRRVPPRWYRLSYLLTCWTSRPEDEHELLSACLVGLLSHDVLPSEWLSVGAALDEPCTVDVAQPPPTDRKSPDLWSALGGQLKPSLDITVTVCLDAGALLAAGPPVTQQPVLVVQAAARERVQGGAASSAP